MNEYMGIPSEVPLGRNSHTAPQGGSELPDNPSTQIQQPDVESANDQYPSKNPPIWEFERGLFYKREPCLSLSTHTALTIQPLESSKDGLKETPRAQTVQNFDVQPFQPSP